jgi:hypothetical protein
MSYEQGEAQERAAASANERERDNIIETGATEIATSVQAILDNMMKEDGSTFWDDTPEGKKRYMATLLHETVKKLGMTLDEVKKASTDNLW